MTDTSEQFQTIGKIEGAERLLLTAVDLFFENGDLLAIHALSTAAHEVIHVLLKTQGKQVSLMKDNPTIRPARAKEYHDIIHQTQNFLKHSSRDAKVTLKYNPTHTQMWLFDAIQMYQVLTGAIKFKKFVLYSLWFHNQFKHLLNDEVIASFPLIGSVDPQYVKNEHKSLLQKISWSPELL